jgi:hypothetical protein
VEGLSTHGYDPDRWIRSLGDDPGRALAEEIGSAGSPDGLQGSALEAAVEALLDALRSDYVHSDAFDQYDNHQILVDTEHRDPDALQRWTAAKALRLP